MKKLLLFLLLMPLLSHGQYPWEQRMTDIVRGLGILPVAPMGMVIGYMDIGEENDPCIQ